jgi:hypothetical protein
LHRRDAGAFGQDYSPAPAGEQIFTVEFEIANLAAEIAGSGAVAPRNDHLVGSFRSDLLQAKGLQRSYVFGACVQLPVATIDLNNAAQICVGMQRTLSLT